MLVVDDVVWWWLGGGMEWCQDNYRERFCTCWFTDVSTHESIRHCTYFDYCVLRIQKKTIQTISDHPYLHHQYHPTYSGHSLPFMAGPQAEFLRIQTSPVAYSSSSSSPRAQGFYGSLASHFWWYWGLLGGATGTSKIWQILQQDGRPFVASKAFKQKSTKKQMSISSIILGLCFLGLMLGPTKIPSVNFFYTCPV